MVAEATVGTVIVASQPELAPLADTPAARASIASYLGAGERMLSMADITWKVCAALLLLVLAAWAIGLLPGAVRLF